MNKDKQKVMNMFDEIAPTYDLLNHLFSFNIDKNWRKKITDELNRIKFRPGKVLDLAAGTGDLTLELLKLSPKEVYAGDISQKMLNVLDKKINDRRVKSINTDSLSMPFDNATFDLVTVGFGVRNFENLSGSIKEINRVMNQGGVFIVLEFFKAEGFKTKLFNFYNGKIMPFFGRLISGNRYAYSYLAESINKFISADEFSEICKQKGFTEIKRVDNFMGVVNTIYFKKI